jgi:hypothetical protein
MTGSCNGPYIQSTRTAFLHGIVLWQIANKHHV